ncbi:MAG: hypothetical protein ACRDRK_17455 [Pseudonocardia sp.]
MSADEHEKPTADSLGVEGQSVGEVDEQPRPGSANQTTAGAPLVEGQPERKPSGRSRRKWLAGLALAVLTVAFTLTLESIANNDSGGAGGALFDAVGRECSAYVEPGSACTPTMTARSGSPLTTRTSSTGE